MLSVDGTDMVSGTSVAEAITIPRGTLMHEFWGGTFMQVLPFSAVKDRPSDG